MRSCHPGIVRELHLRVMRLVGRVGAEVENDSVRLEGGTALAAYYLGHRESEDLDFFSDYSFDQRYFAAALTEAGAAEGLRFESGGASNRTFVRLTVHDPNDPAQGSVKVDLGGQSPFHLAPFEDTAEGIRVGAYRDLVANKLHAASSRIEARDYIDLHVILTHGETDPTGLGHTVRQRTRELVRDVMEIDPGLDPRAIGEGVARGFDRPLLTMFPLQLFVTVTEAEVQQSLRWFVSECAVLVAERMSGANLD